jgi:hypothetical protein
VTGHPLPAVPGNRSKRVPKRDIDTARMSEKRKQAAVGALMGAYGRVRRISPTSFEDYQDDSGVFPTRIPYPLRRGRGTPCCSGGLCWLAEAGRLMRCRLCGSRVMLGKQSSRRCRDGAHGFLP